MRKSRACLLLVISVVSVSLLSSCQSAGKASMPVRTVAVSGSGEVSLQPDIAYFSIQVSEKAKTTAEAQALANQKMGTLLAVLRENGIEEKDISTTSLTLRPDYDWIDNEQVLTGQVASQRLSVTTRDLPGLGNLVDRLGQVSGIQFDSVNFDKDDKSEALAEAREKAVEEAMEKASTYAQSAGMQVGKPISITESSSVSNPYAYGTKMMMATEAMDVRTQVPAGSLTVSATISMVLEMF
jgi:uncharacterized protein YggE